MRIAIAGAHGQIAQRLIAMTPVALPMMVAAEPEPEPLAVVAPKPVGMSLPMA